MKCVFVRTFKKSHNLCVSTERLLADEEQRPSYSLFAFPLFFYFFSIFFSCDSFFSVPPTNQLNGPLNLKVSASLGGQHSDAGRVAGLAEDVSIQRVAALVISF